MSNDTTKFNARQDILANDWYNILNVETTSSGMQITESYRHLAKMYHPDLNKESDAIYKFHLINEAYQILGNEENRAMYDWEMGISSKLDAFRFNITSDIEEIFEISNELLENQITDPTVIYREIWINIKSIAERNHVYTQLKRKLDIIASLDLKLQEFNEGTRISVPIDRYRICSVCRGSSHIGVERLQKCYHCQGFGLEHERIFANIKVLPNTPTDKTIKIPGRGNKTPIGTGDLIIKLHLTSKISMWPRATTRMMRAKSKNKK